MEYLFQVWPEPGIHLETDRGQETPEGQEQPLV